MDRGSPRGRWRALSRSTSLQGRTKLRSIGPFGPPLHHPVELPVAADELCSPLNQSACARHGTDRAGWKSPCQVIAEPKARRRARASSRGEVWRKPNPKCAGRRTGTGYEVWPTRDERARDREVLHPQRGVLYKSGVFAQNDLCLTLGDLSVVLKDWAPGNRRRPTGRSQQRA